MGQTLLGGALTPLESGPIYVNMRAHTHTYSPSQPASYFPSWTPHREASHRFWSSLTERIDCEDKEITLGKESRTPSELPGVPPHLLHFLG